jgi:hypothetical protein
LARERYPAANHAAEAVVKYPLHRPGAPGLASEELPLPLPPGEGRGEGESAATKAPSPYPLPKGEGSDTASSHARTPNSKAVVREVGG